MRTCKEDVMGPSYRVRSGINLETMELIVKGLGRIKHFHNP